MPETTLPSPTVQVNGTVKPSGRVDLTRPAVSGGGGWGVPSVSQTLTRMRTEYEWKYGDELYQRMSQDSIAGGSVKVLRSFTLARSMQLLPNKQPGVGQIVDDPKLQEVFDTSAQIADYCQWVTEKMDRPVDDTLREFCESAWTYGTQLGDIVWKVVPRTEYEGELPQSTGRSLMTIDGIDHKPRKAWAFVVDTGRKKPQAIYGQDAISRDYKLFPIDKFAIATWESKDSDPYGTSIHEMAVPYWNYRVNTWPEAFKFSQRFGTPAPYAYLEEPETGNIYDSRDHLAGRSMADYMLEHLLNWRNGFAIVGRKGDEFGLREPGGDGGSLWNMLDKTRMEIVLAILFQVGATQESQFDSRAKSETSMDVLGNILEYMKRWTCNFWMWHVLYKIVWFGWGKRFADLYTPIASLGATDKADASGLLMALSRVGYRLTPSQLAPLDGELGFPIRQPGEETIPVAGTVKAPDGEGDPEDTEKEAA